ncbi:MAG: DNA gyrase inhibitor YacG [Gammaproteobacteria bacterium]|jgi:endogenous inhibitor of DNA gyrase (YacG/DUF329 family)|nr:DNA gyrase inhibitor YacG [Pseudomonadales bacterium]MBT7227601.1 DNA gyrase inhibitor YacG [Gammaproteobacteria bacterium]MDB3909616.1 DNA gyrase inhibitor YacG [Gammaproteobacteria bacterium]MDC0414235.1 DNA gyrase inhibitor YacG [Gammaproteobacteria bacterium]
MSTKIKTVDCPNCKKAVAWTEENSYRPFCSKRCKLIDFGGWTSERNSIPGQPVYPAVEDEYDQ